MSEKDFMLTLNEVTPKVKVMSTGEIRDTIKFTYKLDTDIPGVKVRLNVTVDREYYDEYKDTFTDNISSKLVLVAKAV